MFLTIPDYPDRTAKAGTTIEAGAWPSLVQLSPLDAAGRLTLSVWRLDGAFDGAAPLGSEEYAIGRGLPSFEAMRGDFAFTVPFVLLGHYLLTQAAANLEGATVQADPAESVVLGAFAAFMAVAAQCAAAKPGDSVTLAPDVVGLLAMLGPMLPARGR